MSEYKYQNGSIGKAFYYLSPDSTEIWGGLDEEKVIQLTEPIQEYVSEAIVYWKENNYFENRNASVLVFRNKNNVACIFVRFDASTIKYYNQVSAVHISRFTVHNKGDGFGSQIINWFKQFNKKITLWSNQEAIRFYEKNGFKFQLDKFVEVEGHGLYTWGEWNK